MRNPYKKFQNSSMHISKVMLCTKKCDEQKDELTNRRMDRQMTQKQYSNLFEVGGIKKAYANSADPDKIVPNGAVWFGSAQFAILLSILSNNCMKSKI